MGHPGPEIEAPEGEEAAIKERVAPGTEEIPAGESVALEVEFHRTRVGPGRGFWVLATVTNPHAQAVTHAHLSAQLLAEDGASLLEVRSSEALALAPSVTRTAVVLVEAPVEHEALVVHAHGVLREGLELAASPKVTLEHDEPLRAKLGGYFVLGQAHNTEASSVTGARIEVRAYDEGDRLLGIDWFELAPLEPDETAPFDLGGLRYEEVPERFALEVVPGAS